MRKIIGQAFISMDGVMQAPGGPTEDPTGGFQFGGWTPGFGDDISNEFLMKVFAKSSYDLLLGRKTYEIFASHWQFAKPGDIIGDPFNKAQKFVLSSKPLEFGWQNSQQVADLAALKKIKASSGPDLLIQGSSTLYPQLFREGLLDRLTLLTYPLMLGRGKRLFGEGTPGKAWKLTESLTNTKGIIIATYEPNGEIKTGTYPFEKPTELENRRQEKMKREG